MNFFDTLYHNSMIFILTLPHDDLVIINLIIMYIFTYGSLLIIIVNIYILLTAKKFFPPIYFNIEDIFGDTEYGFSALIMLLVGCAVMFTRYLFHFLFIIFLLFLMWWIYKKLMLK